MKTYLYVVRLCIRTCREQSAHLIEVKAETREKSEDILPEAIHEYIARNCPTAYVAGIRYVDCM